jgi:hypothetical protein
MFNSFAKTSAFPFYKNAFALAAATYVAALFVVIIFVPLKLSIAQETFVTKSFFNSKRF